MAAGLKCLSGKIALITGAGSGIGAATAELFSKLGASLALTDRDRENLTAVGKACEESSAKKPLLLTGDVTKEENVKRIVDETIKHFEKLHILVNSAGILSFGSIENTSLDQFDLVFRTNVRSAYQLTMLCTPYLVETRGCIVNVSSLAGIRSFAGILAYNMSKSSVDEFTKCVALELAPKQVRCNSVNPGVIMTEIYLRAGMDKETYTAYLERCKATHALGRPGSAEEVAKTIAFLASEDASFITGVNIPVDGGRQAMCP